jgi:hypothetical protein
MGINMQLDDPPHEYALLSFDGGTEFSRVPQ